MRKSGRITKLVLVFSIIACFLLSGCSGIVNKPAGDNTAPAPANSATSESSKDVRTLRLAHTVNALADHPYTVASESFKSTMEKLTNGAVKVDIYPGGQLGGDADIFQALQLGSIDAAVLSTPVIANTTNVLVGFDMPYIFDNNYDILYKVQYGDTGKELLKRLDEKVDGIKSLTFLYQPFRHNWTKKEVKSLADLKGLKFRCMQSPVHVAIYKALGTTPTPVAYTDIYTNMQSGTIDGFEMDVMGAESNKFYEVAKYMTISGHFNNSPMLIMSEKTFNSLTPEQQNAAIEAANQAAADSLAITKKVDAEYTKKMQEHGVTVNQIDLTEFKAAVKPVIDKYAAEIPEVKMVLDAVEAAKKN